MALCPRRLRISTFKKLRFCGAAKRRRHPWHGCKTPRLETLESILAPNLFDMVAGIVPSLAALGSVGVTAVESYVSTTLAIDYGASFEYGPPGAEDTGACDAIPLRGSQAVRPGADAPNMLVPTTDAATPATLANTDAVRPAAAGANGGSPTTPAANDRVFSEPLDLDDLNDLLADDFYLAKGLYAGESPFGQVGTSSGWSPPSGLATEATSPPLTLSNVPAPVPAAVVPLAASQAVEISALVRMAGVEAIPPAAAAATAATRPAPIGKDVVLQTLDQQGLRFEVNKGQIDTRYAFVAHGPTFDVALSSTDATLALSRSQPDAGALLLNMHLLGGDPSATAVGQNALSGITNYFGGPGATYTGVVSYADAAFHNVYGGVDVVYQANPATHQLQYNFVVAPGADPGQIALAFQGTEQLALDAMGDLVLHTSGGDIVQHAPVAYQEIDGTRQAVASSFTIDADNHVRFALGNYDHTRVLTIDPTYVYSSYLGGANTDQANAVAVNPVVQNGQERLFVVGSTSSPTFRPNDPNNTPAINPTLFPANGNFANSAFALEIDPTNNNRPIYLDYFGGNRVQVATAVAVDSNNNAYLTG